MQPPKPEQYSTRTNLDQITNLVNTVNRASLANDSVPSTSYALTRRVSKQSESNLALKPAVNASTLATSMEIIKDQTQSPEKKETIGTWLASYLPFRQLHDVYTPYKTFTFYQYHMAICHSIAVEHNSVSMRCVKSVYVLQAIIVLHDVLTLMFPSQNRWEMLVFFDVASYLKMSKIQAILSIVNVPLYTYYYYINYWKVPTTIFHQNIVTNVLTSWNDSKHLPLSKKPRLIKIVLVTLNLFKIPVVVFGKLEQNRHSK